VMEAWEKAQGTTRVRYLPDGNGELTSALGMIVDKHDLGFGKRSRRYAMVVEDGVVERAFVESEGPGDPFEVSDADSVLGALDPDATPVDVVLVGREGCPHCARARRMLEEVSLPWEEVRSSPRCLRALSGRSTSPQIFVDGLHVGGADDLADYLRGRQESRRNPARAARATGITHAARRRIRGTVTGSCSTGPMSSSQKG